MNDVETFAHIMELDKSVLGNLGTFSASVNVPVGSITFQQFYNSRDLLRRTAGQHSWTRASVITIARAAIGGGFSFIRHPVYGRSLSADEIKNADITLEPLYDFFYGITGDYDSIQDLNTLSSK